MKKILFVLLLGCVALFAASCDKDDDGIDNPFAGTVWKCSSQISISIPGGGSGTVSGYKCLRFDRDMTYLYYEEDEHGVVVNRWGSGNPYRVGLKEGLKTMTYYWSDDKVRGEVFYGNGLPGRFTETESDGKTYTYVLQ